MPDVKKYPAALTEIGLSVLRRGADNNEDEHDGIQLNSIQCLWKITPKQHISTHWPAEYGPCVHEPAWGISPVSRSAKPKKSRKAKFH